MAAWRFKVSLLSSLLNYAIYNIYAVKALNLEISFSITSSASFSSFKKKLITFLMKKW